MAGLAPLFFGLELLEVALIEISMLVVFVIITTWKFLRVDGLAGWFMVPYVSWVLFASVLNGWVAIAN